MCIFKTKFLFFFSKTLGTLFFDSSFFNLSNNYLSIKNYKQKSSTFFLQSLTENDKPDNIECAI